MECAPPPVDLDVKHEPSSLKRKYDRAMQQQADLYQSTDELEKWLHTSGVLEAARLELLRNFQLSAKNAATEVERTAFNTVTNQLMLNSSCALSHVSKVGAALLRGLQDTNQLSMLPKTANNTNGAASAKPAKSSKKAASSAK